MPDSVRYRRLDGTFDGRIREISGVDAADIAQSMINAACGKKIGAVTGSLNLVSEEFELANSSGLGFCDEATYVSGVINAESEAGGTPVSGIGHGCCRTLKEFPAERIGRDARTLCIESASPHRIEPGRYSIIFEPYSVGELLAFVVAPNFSLKALAEKRSCFSGSMGRSIAVDGLDISDDPHAPEGIGTKSVDDEGVATSKRGLVVGGIFTDALSNLLEALQGG